MRKFSTVNIRGTPERRNKGGEAEEVLSSETEVEVEGKTRREAFQASRTRDEEGVVVFRMSSSSQPGRPGRVGGTVEAESTGMPGQAERRRMRSSKWRKGRRRKGKRL